VHGTKYLNDRIRIGNTYAIGAKSNSVCKISDITNIKCTQKKTENRYQTAKELMTDLKKCKNSLQKKRSSEADSAENQGES